MSIKHLLGKIDLSLHINDQPIQLRLDATTRLVDILRRELKLTGTKISCGIGRCGVCSVMVDGQLANSCLLMAYQVNNTSITTIEKIGEQNLHPIQQAFVDEGGFQCGYCTPGMIMAVKSLLDKFPDPTEEQILESLSGNLCRCTGYSGIIRSIQHMI